MSNEISDGRKGIYNLGLGFIVVGFILFMSSFLMVGEPSFSFGPPPFFKRAVIGMICIIVGSLLRIVSAKGAAGSGLILDPEKSREDLKPFSSAKGKIINDVIENIDIVKNMGDKQNGNEVKEIIKVRCRNCEQLNDEDSRFCKSCGKEI